MKNEKEDGFEGEKRITVPPLVVNQYLTNDIFKNLFITDIGYYPKARHHFCRRSQGCKEHILIHCVDGRGRVVIDQQEFKLSANQFILIPAGQCHSYQADPLTPWSIYWMHISGQQSDYIAEHIFEEIKKKEGILAMSEKHQSLFDKMYNLLLQGYSKEHMMLISLSLPYYLSRYMFPEAFNSSENENRNDIIEKSIIYLKENLEKKIVLKDLADSVYLSVSHFSKMFKYKTGYSPIEYLNHLKIQKACSLLQFSQKRISQISYEVGFDDQYYFSRLFKQQMGMSPSVYRGSLENSTA